jgi:hypothetical protein
MTEPEIMYTESERAEQIRKMKICAERFYWMCTQTGVHAFIEFNGLIAKYIDLCERAHAAGLDYNVCNTHTGVAMPLVKAHDVYYMAEKLECIFGPTLDDPQIRKAFLEALFPEERAEGREPMADPEESAYGASLDEWQAKVDDRLAKTETLKRQENA